MVFRVLNIAHRGASGHAPENTIAAFRMAVEMGAEMIEFDLHETKDGHFVVIHDETLKRTTGDRRGVEEVTLEELKSLDAGSWFGRKYAGEKVPTLSEVCEHLPSDIPLNIEIKGVREGSEGRLLSLIKDYRREESVLISSFDHQVLFRIREKEERVPIGLLFRRKEKIVYERISRFAASSLHLSTKSVTEDAVEKTHRRGISLYVYTVDRKREMKKFLRMGVDGIFTNYPDRLAQVLRDPV